jgi:hypothetical protein
LLGDDELEIQARRPLPLSSLRGATLSSEVKLPGRARFRPRRRHRSLARWSRRGWPTKKAEGGLPPLPHDESASKPPPPPLRSAPLTSSAQGRPWL